MTKKVLVYGATGDQGIPLVRQLAEKGYQVVATARSIPEKPEFEHPNVRWDKADFDKPETLTRINEECDLIAMHLPFVFDVDYCRTMGGNIMAAAKAGDIEKVVFHTSCYVADHDLDLSAHDGRRAIEKAIEDSGIPYAVIRSAVFMDNMQRAWLKPSIVKNGIFAYPAAEDLLISWVSLEDIAAYMIAALEAEDVTADKFMVGGPEALVGSQVAEILSKVLGRTVEFKSLSPDQFAQEMAFLVTGSRDVEPHSIYDGMAKFYAFYNNQPESPLNVDLEQMLKRLKVTPTSLEDWARAQDWSV